MRFDNIKTAWVDFDGTLLDSSGCWPEAYRLLCKHRAAKVNAETLRAFGKLPFDKWQDHIFEQLGSCGEALMDCAKIAYSRRSPKKSVLSVIASLPCDAVVTVITKEPKELVEFWLSRYGITLFSGIVTVGDERTNADYYKRDGLLLIDDNYKHCQAAKSAGAFVIGVNDRHDGERSKLMRELCDIYI